MLARKNEGELLREAKQLGDEELLAGLALLLRDDRALTVQLLVHMGEVDARGLYREHAYASMFEYAVEALHMSESEAYTRIRAARVSREFPVVLGMLARGELHLSAVKLLAPVLTAGNREELLQAARLKSKRQVERALAQRFPKADVPSVIRKLPAKLSTAVLPAAVSGALPVAAGTVPENSNSISRSERVSHHEPAPSLQLAPCPVPKITPLRADRYKVQFTASQRLHDKLEQAQDLLRHQVPDVDLATVVERALDLLIAERMKKRFALVRKPRAKTQPHPSRASRSRNTSRTTSDATSSRETVCNAATSAPPASAASSGAFSSSTTRSRAAAVVRQRPRTSDRSVAPTTSYTPSRTSAAPSSSSASIEQGRIDPGLRVAVIPGVPGRVANRP